jgi:hypothetical protein|nr:MAG TPA: hypothetical protein [Caudoviricetes sp.]
MIKEALEYIVGLKTPVITEIDGNTYSDKPLNRISYVPYAKTIGMKTLTSLVEYIKANIDSMSERMIVHVISPTEVHLYSSLDADRKREYLVEVNAELPDFRFGSFIDHENFVIALQSKFVPNEDRDLVLKFAGTVEDGTVAEYGDDGVTQKATIKTGVASKADAVVPNPVNLIPYRTFLEVQQPASDFIFRMKSSCGVQCAIFEADGGAWKNEAMSRIKNYLALELSEYPQFTVIS